MTTHPYPNSDCEVPPTALPPTNTTPAIHTDGGAVVQGNVTPGGDFVGRDKITVVVQRPEDAVQFQQQQQRIAALREGTFARLLFEPETVFIPAGVFWMGSDTDTANEAPRHQVFLPDFRMGKYPVTNAEYLAFVRDQSIPVAPETGWILAAIGQEPPLERTYHPVIGVSWDDAVRYCAWLKDRSGRAYRLPSEAEWEKAARGAEGLRYPWGNTFDTAHCNSLSAGIGTTTDVCTYSVPGASCYGCVDMAGNVWEWTNTIWGIDRNVARYKYPYQADDGREKLEKSVPFRELRICRGGSYQDKSERLTCTTRARQPADTRAVQRGFRVLMEI